MNLQHRRPEFSGIGLRDAALERWQSLKYMGQDDMQDYLNNIKRLADMLKYDETAVRDRFLMGLPATIRIEAAKGEDINKCLTEPQRYVDITGVTKK